MATMHAGHSMAGQQDSSHAPLAQAAQVGNQFVTQYYTVLHKQPHFLHRFYTDDSTMTYSEAGSTEALVFNSQKKIHEKVMSLGYQDAVTEIYSVDSQYSLQDGVIVQVTGSLRCTNRPKRSFTQTFFLAVQEKGYFVLNDLFRLLPDPVSAPQGFGESAANPTPQENGYATSHSGLHPPPIEHPPQLNGTVMPPAVSMPPAPAAPIPAPQPPVQQPPQQQQQPQQQAAPTPPPPAPQQQQQQQPEDPPQQPAEQAAPKEPEAPAPQQADQEDAATPAKPESEPVPEEPEMPAAPLTYAERLKQGAKAAPKPVPPRPSPKPAPVADATPPAEGNGTEAPAPATGGYGQEDAPGCSIFVKDLPADITAEKLAEVFGQFGNLAGPRAVNLKSQKDKPSFAFIEFAQASSASTAISTPVQVDGQTVRVDEKKPLYMLRGGRGGRFGDGGRGGRFDGGRGYYGRGGPGGRGGPVMPGRGPGRGDFVGGRGYAPEGGRGRGPRPDGGRGRGPPGGGRGPPGGRGGPRPPQPGAGAPAPAPAPEQPAAATEA